MSFHLDRFPLPVDLGEYQRIAAVIEAQLAGLPGLVAIYGVGGLSAPGQLTAESYADIYALAGTPGDDA